MGNSRCSSDFISFQFLNLDLIQDFLSSCVWISKEMNRDQGQIARSRASLLKCWASMNACEISFCSAGPSSSHLLPLLTYLMGVQESEFWVLFCLFLPSCCCLLIYSEQINSCLIYVSSPFKISFADQTKLSLQSRGEQAGRKDRAGTPPKGGARGSRTWSSWRCQDNNQQLVPLLSLC